MADGIGWEERAALNTGSGFPQSDARKRGRKRHLGIDPATGKQHHERPLVVSIRPYETGGMAIVGGVRRSERGKETLSQAPVTGETSGKDRYGETRNEIPAPDEKGREE